MSDETTYTRRMILRASAATTVAGGGLLAGCAGDGGGGDDGGTDGGDGGMDGDTDGGEETPEDGDEETPEDGGDEETPEDGGDGDDWQSYMEDANNYDGEAEDMTGEDAVTVTVGGGQGFAFDPAAVRISTGTTITWEWTGEGGQHNVVAEDGTFESELKEAEGETFEHTFEEAATYKYYCEPHQGAGMLGTVIVE